MERATRGYKLKEYFPQAIRYALQHLDLSVAAFGKALSCLLMKVVSIDSRPSIEQNALANSDSRDTSITAGLGNIYFLLITEFTDSSMSLAVNPYL